MPRVSRLRRATHAALLLASLLLLACHPEELTGTLAGDLTGLTVEMSAVPVGPFTVDIVILRSTQSLPVSYTDTFPNGPRCGPRSTTATVQAGIPE
jgi:hypothetical protein